jgi:hypothetical protein
LIRGRRDAPGEGAAAGAKANGPCGMLQGCVPTRSPSPSALTGLDLSRFAGEV